MVQLLVIFDLDGTLVDSEPLCNQAFLDLLPSLSETVVSLVNRYRGKKLAEILSDIENKLGHSLPEGFEARYRQRVADLFATELKPMRGVPEMLGQIQHPFCIASSGPPEKIRHALAITGLATHFGERLFSSYLVKSWKPDPGLFLHAAATLGFAPEQCVVVEDSPVGLKAAAAAGMQALHYAPHLVAQGNTFSSMLALPSILEQIATA
ncbi:HAD-IA family hydrolase [Iodobacter sp.]|uniref:HAD-IA family hydrolase n=1 Tax=Iodobacter sp. TaxID=1915058 RepID=UPI0025D05849|nr:HAD-IA family hydrolase [Iodobacter sp.]